MIENQKPDEAINCRYLNSPIIILQTYTMTKNDKNLSFAKSKSITFALAIKQIFTLRILIITRVIVRNDNPTFETFPP